jgi:hypothetical protein
MEQKSTRRGGARPNSGRPRKDPNIWGQVTCVLRRDTIQKLKDGCGGASKHFGQFLQDHLDEFPLPSRELYLHKQEIKAIRAKAKLAPDYHERMRRVRESERLIRELKRKRRDQLHWEKRRAEDPEWFAIMEKISRDQRREQAKKAKAEVKAAKEAAKAAKAAA